MWESEKKKAHVVKGEKTRKRTQEADVKTKEKNKRHQ